MENQSIVGYFASGNVDRKVTVTLSEEYLEVTVEGFGMWNHATKQYKEIPIIQLFYGETLFLNVLKDLNGEWDYPYEETELSSMELPDKGQFQVQWQWETKEGVFCTFSRWLDIPSTIPLAEISFKNEVVAHAVLYEWTSIIPEDRFNDYQIVAYRLNGKEVLASDTGRKALNAIEIINDILNSAYLSNHT